LESARVDRTLEPAGADDRLSWDRWAGGEEEVLWRRELHAAAS
jgi:hypothetical protein